MKIKGVNKREFRKNLTILTGCNIQTGGWTCATCFFHLMNTLKIPADNPEWRALLYYRGEKEALEGTQITLKFVEQFIRELDEEMKEKEK